MDLPQVVAVSRQLALEAGKAILEVYATDFGVEHKADASPVTVADRRADALIRRGLEQAFPGRAILSEETEDDLSRLGQEYCFIVDPLDGTKQFVSRAGQFTVNIALCRGGKAVAGVIYVPVYRELYFAWEGGGAYLVEEDGVLRPIGVSDKLEGLTFVGSASHSTPREAALLEAHKDVIAQSLRSGSARKGCMVAAGVADIYYRYGPTCQWDTAAMECIVTEAGGIVVQPDGTPLVYNREDTINRQGFCCVNRRENLWL